ncbi:MAG TPA: Fe-S oxidoreductase [Lachnospiraceae bacterium]|nr:Fe-S oxidoreductase [Lachnospiraceae bacterium]
MKVRIKYSKTGPVKFISHLDVMRYFQKAIRRAELDISYSTGMSPHQIISFAAPMPLMMESVGEYCDAEFERVTSSKEMVEAFNSVASPFIKMMDIVLLPDDAINSMAAVTASDYLITLTDKGKTKFGMSDESDYSCFSGLINEINNSDKVEVLKKTKKSEAVTDIKPLIYDLSVVMQEDNNTANDINVKEGIDSANVIEQNDRSEASIKHDGIYMLLATGSHENIKPENVLTAICDKAGKEYDRFDYNILRLETYFGNPSEGFKPLSAAGNQF